MNYVDNYTVSSDDRFSAAGAMNIAVSLSEPTEGTSSSLEELLKRYKEKDPGVFSIGGTFGIDSNVFRLELSDVYISVVDILDNEGKRDGKLLAVQGIAYFRIGKIITISAVLIGEYDPDILTDPLELFNKEPESEQEREEAMRTRNKFHNLSGDTVRRYEFIGDAKGNNGLYFLIDGNGGIKEKQYVFTATGLLDLDWLKKIGVNCGLKLGAVGAYNSFENSWEVGLGVKFTIPSGTEWLVVGRVGFKSGQINTIALEVRGEIPIGPVVFTQIKMGVSGMAETVQTYSPGLGAAFGPQIDFNALSSKITKLLGLETGKFRLVELGASGEVSSDFRDVSLSVEGKLFGNLEIKGGWKMKEGTYHEVSLSVGTKSSPTFNFRISGSASWGNGQLTVKAGLDGHFKWDFTALGVAWVGVDVGGGVSFIYNQLAARKTLSIAVNGRAKVKVAFVKFGVNVANSWFIDLSSRELATACANARLEDAPTSAKLMLRDDAAENDEQENFRGEKIGSYSWNSTELAAVGRTYVTVAAQYSLTDLHWVLYGPGGRFCTSSEPDATVRVKQISYSQFELLVDNAECGDWTLDVYGSRRRNGEVCIFAEAGDPVETGVRVVSVDKTAVTVEYLAHATGDSYLAALYMERADRPDDEYEGTILDYLEATGEDEYRRVTIGLPEDVQGGKYKFYVMAQSTNCAEVAYSAKTEPVDILVRTASLEVKDYRVEFQAADLSTANIFCTVANSGTVDSGEFIVEVLLGDSEIGTDDVGRVIASASVSLAAGAGRELRLTSAVPEEYIGRLAAMSIRLDRANTVDEGVFEEDNTVVKTIAPAAATESGGTVLTWTAVEGAVSYDLEYAVEGDWNDSAVLCGFTKNSADLILAPGHYTFRVIARDAAGEAIMPGGREWCESVLFSSAFALPLDPGAAAVSTGQFELLDGFYDWTSVDLSDFTGTLTLNQVEGTRRGYDDPKMIAEVVGGRVTGGSVTSGILLDNGLYYFTASGSGTAAMQSGLSFSISGELFPNLGPERGVVSLPDCVDESGRYSETLKGWVGAFDGEDSWEFLLEDAGELSLLVNEPGKLTGTLVVELYVQSSGDGQYYRTGTFSVDASSPGTLLDSCPVTNNFFVRVGASDNGRGRHNSEYSLDLSFSAFDDSPLEEGEWLIAAGKEPVQVEGWVGCGKTSETYLLTVDSGCAGRYDFRLTGDAGEATLNILSVSGRLVKSASLNGQGVAVIPDFELYSGDYLVEIDSRNDVEIGNNTKYKLAVSRNEAFELISATDSAEVRRAEQGEKLFFALDIPESGLYDVSELQQAGLTVWFQEADGNGSLGPAKLRPEWAELEWDVPGYMTVCNLNSAWGDAVISLDSEKHKFVFSAVSAANA